MSDSPLLEFVVGVLRDHKARSISVFDVRTLMIDITDYMVVASATSTRQAASIGELLIEKAKHSDQPPLGVEGLPEGEWVLIDLVDVVVHIMIPEIRELYNLEALFSHPPASASEIPSPTFSP